MQKDSNTFKNSKTNKILFFLCIFLFVFSFLGQSINIYRFAVVGAIFEILWLPVLAGIIVVPILSIIYLIKEKFYLRSLNFYSILISVITILQVFLHK
jgi:hypothetical protein